MSGAFSIALAQGSNAEGFAYCTNKKFTDYFDIKALDLVKSPLLKCLQLKRAIRWIAYGPDVRKDRSLRERG